ncbi:Hpt domain-containing protein [Clostridium formicaceticum]|uniref:HPt domain-containing protein n=1 Tax=Clostridium formicaceticum TaxID=1497 RepID=A0AAC9RP94_9CLOT|nr:Hpt domain-containing protein [Clostridium formicaceticum]AOY78129.1 hypothetical protein BJL90_21045 [Clostridium formicaceticum]ARE88780.1 hypothetical protein CLFO_31860 [Clostridium formicaceticum]
MNDFHMKTVIEEMGIGAEDLVILYEEYFKEMEENILLMKELVEVENYQALQSVVHNIKGISINLFVKGVYDKAHELDILLKKNIVEESKLGVHEIARLYYIAREVIEKAFTKNPALE